MAKSYTCPLCGTPLSPDRFAAVMQAHRGMERQLERLRRAEARATAELKRARDQARETTARAKRRAAEQVETERRRAADRLKKHQQAANTLRARIEELEQRLKRGETAQSEGLLEERALLAFLKSHFRGDRFAHPGKGGDILQEVCNDSGDCAGRLLYEVKRTQQWANSHVRQAAEARVAREADIAILVTNRFPAKRPHFFVERDVLVISPLGLLAIVHTAREGLLNAHGLRVSGNAKQRAVRAIYDYLAGGPYLTHVRRIAQHLTDLEALFHKEISGHRKMWDSRLDHYRGLATRFGSVHDALRSLIAPVTDSEAPHLRPAKALLPAFHSPAHGSNRRPRA